MAGDRFNCRLADSGLSLLIGNTWSVAARRMAPTWRILPPRARKTSTGQLCQRGKAFETSWGRCSPVEREARLRRFGDLIASHADELGEIEALNNGKLKRKACAIDAPVAARLAQHFAGWPSKIAGYTPAVSSTNHFVYTRREPLGVVAIILPWNYPLIHAVQKISPALACGNTVILKPSQWATLPVLRLGELLEEAGFPPGVVNIVTGTGAEIGAAIAKHPEINKVQFTGSTAVGREMVIVSAGNLKRVGLELGNKAPNIIFADADLDAAIPGAFQAAFGFSGQSCVAARGCTCRNLFLTRS